MLIYEFNKNHYVVSPTGLVQKLEKIKDTQTTSDLKFFKTVITNWARKKLEDNFIEYFTSIHSELQPDFFGKMLIIDDYAIYSTPFFPENFLTIFFNAIENSIVRTATSNKILATADGMNLLKKFSFMNSTGKNKNYLVLNRETATMKLFNDEVKLLEQTISKRDYNRIVSNVRRNFKEWRKSYE